MAEALGMLGSATLAVQTVVLGASLFQRTTSVASRQTGSLSSSSSSREGMQPYPLIPRGALQGGPVVQIVTPQSPGDSLTQPKKP